MNRVMIAIGCLLVAAVGAMADEHGYAENAAGIVSALTAKPALTRSFAPNPEVKSVRRIVRREEGDDVSDTVQVPVVPKTGGAVNLRICFDTGKSVLRPESIPLLGELAKALRAPELTGRKVAVNGHTDADGDADMNRVLSLERAWAVRNYLVANQGIDLDRLLVQGFGEELPLLPNITAENKGLNRRVEIALTE